MILGPNGEQPPIRAVAQKGRGRIFLAITKPPLGAEVEWPGTRRLRRRVQIRAAAKNN
jgi:hypothetical protein